MKRGEQTPDPVGTGRRRRTAGIATTRAQRGFTLIEVMITVAIVAILAAIAYPSYQEQVRKSRRGQLKSDLTELAQVMERFFTNNNTYATAAGPDGKPGTADDLAAGLFGTSPRGAVGTAILYDITLATPANTFTFTATPKVGSAQAGDSCGIFKLDNAGKKTPATAGCW